jgi:alanyl-tRNA synthetase
MIDARDRLIADTAKELKCPNANDLSKRAVMVQDEIKSLKREIDALNAKLASSKLDDLVKSAKDVKGVALITADLGDTGVDSARNLCDTVKDKMPGAVIVLAIHSGEKLNFVAACGKDATAKGAHAGNILREISAIAGGKGGGRPDSAMSGGRDLSKIADALAATETVLSGMIK